MFRLALVAACVLALAPLAAAQAAGAVPMLFTSNLPTMDGTMSPGEWVTPGHEQVSSADGAIVKFGSFTGAADLTINAWYMFSSDQIWIAVEVHHGQDQDPVCFL